MRVTFDNACVREVFRTLAEARANSQVSCCQHNEALRNRGLVVGHGRGNLRLTPLGKQLSVLCKKIRRDATSWGELP